MPKTIQKPIPRKKRKPTRSLKVIERHIDEARAAGLMVELHPDTAEYLLGRFVTSLQRKKRAPRPADPVESVPLYSEQEMFSV